VHWVSRRCPSKVCANHEKPAAGFFVKRGYYKTKWNGQPVPRYRCRDCGRYFSSHSLKETFGQHRPDLNRMVLRLYASGISQRRMAIVLGVNLKTIVRKFRFLGKLARKEHERRIASGEFKTRHVQFDEMETFEHTRMKPVSVALAVRVKTGEILAVECAPMAYKGPLAAQARDKYGPREDQTGVAIKKALVTVGLCSALGLALTTDADPRYLNQVRQELPSATHRSIKRRFAKKDRRNAEDHLFTLNYTAAKIRNDLSRMGRKTWVTTKKIACLQAHLDLYVAFNNGYSLPV
jgi:transposase-like protein